jgi:hypothetical protein
LGGYGRALDEHGMNYDGALDSSAPPTALRKDFRLVVKIRCMKISLF